MHKELNPLLVNFIHQKDFESSVPHRLHFGLGDTKSVDSLNVFWLDGTQEVFYELPTNELITLTPTETAFQILNQ